MTTIYIRSSLYKGQPAKIFYTSEYNSFFVECIKSLVSKDNRLYNPSTKEWTVIKTFNSVISLLSSDNNFEIKYLDGNNVEIGKRKKVTAEEKESNNLSLDIKNTFDYSNFDFSKLNLKIELLAHQKEFIAFTDTKYNTLLFDEMGLGKSIQAIGSAINYKLKGCKKCFIVCGYNTLRYNWLYEVEKVSKEKAYILGSRKITRGKNKNKITLKGNKYKYDDILNLFNVFEYFIIINIEAIRDDKILRALNNYLSKNECCIIFDEIQAIKSPDSIQTKNYLVLNAKYKIGLTGTPIMNTPLDLWSSLKWLQYTNSSFNRFKNYFVELTNQFGKPIKYKKIDELQMLLNKIAFRRLKKNVIDLPEKQYIDEFLMMSKEQAHIYELIKDDIRTKIIQLEKSEITNPMEMLLRLRQTTGDISLVSDNKPYSIKYDRALEIIKDCINNNLYVLIFSNWSTICKNFNDILKKEGILSNIFIGDTNLEERATIIQDFNNGKYKCLVGTVGAMGTGITLTKASVVIFLDSPFTNALKQQAVDRVHRVGQDKNVLIYSLICKDTVDEHIEKLVKIKSKIANAIIDNEMDLSIPSNIQLLNDIIMN